MHPVFLHSWESIEYSGEAEILPGNRYKRRMTDLQVAILAVFDKAKQTNPSLIESLIECPESLFIFSSGLGEINTNSQITNSIVSGDYQISPKNFHNSVYNGTAGYLTVSQKFTNECLSINDGYLSLDLSMQVAFNLIRSGQKRSILVISGHEHTNRDPLKATAEILVFSSVTKTHSPIAKLVDIKRQNSKMPHKASRVHCFQDADQNGWATFKMPSPDRPYRYVQDSSEQGILSQWEAL